MDNESPAKAVYDDDSHDKCTCDVCPDGSTATGWVLKADGSTKKPTNGVVLTRVPTTNAAECNSMCANHFD